ncbi:hypothetical protein AG1IA_03193 [Rhizoctonia solani AG-1 IA]|uniref:Uncharacterized protein n=1 Tax=Thanatephorus cucumeris (strain AG1-IA) TaxID=983506 RepID=L8X131_THACA|nr:hypothetical protein AG1IA_03193 [Rhizoctonia solani AG-1 IA]
MASAFRAMLRKPDFASRPEEEDESPEERNVRDMKEQLAEEGRDIQSVRMKTVGAGPRLHDDDSAPVRRIMTLTTLPPRALFPPAHHRLACLPTSTPSHPRVGRVFFCLIGSDDLSIRSDGKRTANSIRTPWRWQPGTVQYRVRIGCRCRYLNLNILKGTTYFLVLPLGTASPP